MAASEERNGVEQGSSGSPHGGSPRGTIFDPHPLQVVVVDTGQLHPIDLCGTGALSNVLADATGVARADQILLTADGGKVEESVVLAQSGGGSATGAGDDGGDPAEGAELYFLFNRRTLGSGGEPAPIAYDLEADIIAPDSASHTYQATATDDTGMAVVKLYERTFCLHLDQARATLQGCRERQSFLQQNLGCAQNQMKALQVATANLQSHSYQIKGAMSGFLHRFDTETAKHTALLGEVDKQLQLLGEIVLDPDVAAEIDATGGGEGAPTLLDCCESEESLRKHAVECAAFIQSLKAKVELVPAVLVKLEREVEKIVAGTGLEEAVGQGGSEAAAGMSASRAAAALSGGSLREAMSELSQCVAEGQPKLARLEQLQEALSGDHAAMEGRTGEKVPADFESFYQQDKQHKSELLPELQALAEELGSHVVHSCAARNHVAKAVAAQLHRVSAMQYAIVQQVNDSSLWRERERERSIVAWHTQLMTSVAGDGRYATSWTCSTLG
jgi:hypothetical protein